MNSRYRRRFRYSFLYRTYVILANRNNYEYTEEEAQKIIAALETEVKAVKSKFAAESKRRSTFKL